MPDLDQLFDTLVDDVNSGIQAPGAPAAIRQAHQRSRKNTVAAVAAVALIAVGGAVTAGTLSDGAPVSPVSPIEEPTLTEQGSPTVSPNFAKTYWGKLGRAMAQVPGWAISDTDPAIAGPCGGDWTAAAEGGSGGTLGLGPSGPPEVYEELLGFSSPAKASDAADRLLENLVSCAIPWQIQPIATTNAVMASSARGVIWIVRKGTMINTLQVPTEDGPPPLPVQVEVADIMLAP